MVDNKKEPEGHRMLTVRMRWDDPERVRAWLSMLRESILDGLAAGEDATRKLKKRVLSRAEARRKLRAAERRIEDLFKVAEEALPPGEQKS